LEGSIGDLMNEMEAEQSSEKVIEKDKK